MDEDRANESAGRSDGKAASGISRRSLCVGVLGTAALFGVGGLSYVKRDPVVRPPGGQDESRLISACIRCQKCVESCPRGVIVPAHVETGFVNLRTPTMNFDANWCDWCAQDNGGQPLCVEVCPTKALSLPEGANFQNTLIGKAVLYQDLCLAYRMTGCAFCYDACPYEAIELDEQGYPSILLDKCNGCGACESACVSMKNASISAGSSHRAIVIEPLEKAEG